MESSTAAGWSAALVERHRADARFRDLELRATPDLHLVTALSGEHRFEMRSQRSWVSTTYGRGAVGLTPGNEGGRLRCYSEAPYEIGHLYLPQRLLAESAEGLRRAGQPTERTLSRLRLEDPAIPAVLVALLAAARAGAPDLYAEQAVCWLATHLLSMHGEPAGRAPPSRASADRRLGRAVELVRTHYDQPLSLDRLASEAGVSKFHFSRLFQQRTGRSPHAFLVDERMAAARRLLAQTDLAVAEVAHRTGYARRTQFAVAFTRRHGLSASDYRRQSRGREIPPAAAPGEG